MKKYFPHMFEDKWTERWQDEKLYQKPEIQSGDSTFYSLYSFPYPSGAGLHVGHVEGMVANDIAVRFERMKGNSAFLPMGWDSFGLPAENYAIKTGIHPKDSTNDVIEVFREQIKKIGISVDWDSEVGAHTPEYYRWTQWIFLQLYKAGLAYQKEAAVNFCPHCNTTLANEQVVDGVCERCDTAVVQRNMKQWFFKITAYADQLHHDLDGVDWPKSTKEQQRNWIGRKEGINITYQVEGLDDPVTVFTTRPDTNYGATFIVLAPESAYVSNNLDTFPKADEVRTYVEKTAKKTERQRMEDGRKKTGVFTGLYALNKLNGRKLPVFVGDFVLASFGTGAVVGVPGHDMRDFEFAQAMGLDIVRVVVASDGDTSEITKPEQVQEEEGTMVNSEFLDGMDIHTAKETIMDYLEKKGWGERIVTYRLRDWLVSRQRYWGAPIPIVYDPEGNAHPVDESDLPVLLPYDVDFKPTGESPLKNHEDFHKSAEEKYGKGWRREVDTMDTFVDSSWYFFRHLSAQDHTKVFSTEEADMWLPTDLYMIGAEHIVLHLLYSRFFTKFFRDQGLISFGEPFQRMRHMGTILGPDGRKMSKRWGNVVNPTDVINEYGADAVRMYEMFMGPLDQSKPWNPDNLQGVYRFLQRVWRLYQTEDAISSNSEHCNENAHVKLQKTIQKVTQDIPSLKCNTAIAAMMEFLNEWETRDQNGNVQPISHAAARDFLKILAPFAPFVTEEIWREQFGNQTSIHTQPWPSADETLMQEEQVELPVQVNGRVRGTIRVSAQAEITEDEILSLAQKHEKIASYLEQGVKKVIYIPGKIINIII